VEWYFIVIRCEGVWTLEALRRVPLHAYLWSLLFPDTAVIKLRLELDDPWQWAQARATELYAAEPRCRRVVFVFTPRTHHTTLYMVHAPFTYSFERRSLTSNPLSKVY
jgi:hypothetical protein